MSLYNTMAFRGVLVVKKWEFLRGALVAGFLLKLFDALPDEAGLVWANIG